MVKKQIEAKKARGATRPPKPPSPRKKNQQTNSTKEQNNIRTETDAFE
jgi:hypothetical protein